MSEIELGEEKASATLLLAALDFSMVRAGFRAILCISRMIAIRVAKPPHFGGSGSFFPRAAPAPAPT